MLYQLYNFPRTKPFIVACSGGVDSMAIATFYKRGNKNFSVAYFHHGTPQADEMQTTVREWSDKNNVPMLTGKIERERRKDESPEEYFRNERYRWLCSLPHDIITCHHLNDAVEGWIFSSLHGNPKLIKSVGMISDNGVNNTVYRPFLTNTKQQLIDWCVQHGVKWCEDKSNTDTKYPRNFIRHELLQQCLRVNPGLLNTIRKKILREEHGKEDSRTALE
jgi:tRNA(Ile)-lysidine synthase